MTGAGIGGGGGAGSGEGEDGVAEVVEEGADAGVAVLTASPVTGGIGITCVSGMAAIRNNMLIRKEKRTIAKTSSVSGWFHIPGSWLLMRGAGADCGSIDGFCGSACFFMAGFAGVGLAAGGKEDGRAFSGPAGTGGGGFRRPSGFALGGTGVGFWREGLGEKAVRERGASGLASINRRRGDS